MNVLFDDFATAHAIQNGYMLAQTLSPVPPSGDPHRLREIWQSTNFHSAKGDIKHFIKAQTSYQKGRGLDHDEINGWVEVYVVYWKAVGEILSCENGKVSPAPECRVMKGRFLTPKLSHRGPRCTSLGETSPRY